MSETSPDSRLVTRFIASPNHDARTRPADMLVLHYTGMASGDAACARLCEPDAKVSSHHLVHEDGRIVQLVAEDRRAWHAGEAAWDGESDINARSIGIEIVNVGHDLGYPDFPDRQIEAVIALGRDIVARHGIRADRVVAHSDVAPARKRDPGEKFPWARLASAGVGLWVEPAPVTSSSMLCNGDRGDDVRALQQALARYGYGAADSGLYDDATLDIVTAFQRHFRPARVDGVADLSTRDTLRRLLAARDALVAGG